MRRSHVQPPTVSLGVNLTPLIDVVFILLIFFVVTSSFVKESGIDVQRPKAHTAVRKERGNIIISINKEGEIWLDKRRVDRRMLRAHIERLHAENPEGSIVIVADKNSLTGLVVDVLDQARLAGVPNVAIAATRGTSK
jgi:biopolymer transport protein ExbD